MPEPQLSWGISQLNVLYKKSTNTRFKISWLNSTAVKGNNCLEQWHVISTVCTKRLLYNVYNTNHNIQYWKSVGLQTAQQLNTNSKLYMAYRIVTDQWSQYRTRIHGSAICCVRSNELSLRVIENLTSPPVNKDGKEILRNRTENITIVQCTLSTLIGIKDKDKYKQTDWVFPSTEFTFYDKTGRTSSSF